MNEDDDNTSASTSLLQSVLAFTWKGFRSQKRQAWLRADAFIQHDVTVRVGKRGREREDVIRELSQLEEDRKKRRVLPREEPTRESSLDNLDVDFAVRVRGHLVALDNALRRHWVCVCKKCSGLSVRLSLPQHMQSANLKSEVSFEVVFGVQSVPAGILQEARITVK